LEKAWKRITATDSTLGKRIAIWAAMITKMKIGIDLKTKKLMKKRILSVAKRGSFLPILSLLGVVGSLIGGAAGVTKAINDNKAAQRQLEELKRHNRIMEDHGIYLAPYKYGRGTSTKKTKKNKNNQRNDKKGPTINAKLQQLAKRVFHILYFYAYYFTNRSISK